MAADASRRFLIAAGTEHYGYGDVLASVPEDLSKITRFFGSLGYREQLPDVRLDPSSNVLREALAEWLNSSERQASDTAVIYYSGHGDSQASYFYLLTADSRENRYADTALRADYVLEALGENPKVRRILLILDACYAAQGAFNAAEVAARMSPYLNFTGDDEGVWVVAAAGQKQEAGEGLFADAFLEAAGQLQEASGTLQPYIDLGPLIAETNAILSRCSKQRANWMPVTQARGLAPFIPNLRYEPGAPLNMDLETRGRLRRRRAAELAEHWGPKARGVEVAAQAGWYFTGRHAAMAELTAWLADPAADTRLRIVTGNPGSGKSALLGRLVTLADNTSTAKPQGSADDFIVTPPAGSITAALLARGKTADELLAELAEELGLAPDVALAEMLLPRPVFTVVIDALDEAVDPLAVVDQVILPLHGAAAPSHGPRLLVAMRKYQHLFRTLPRAQVTLDLDRDAYYSETDTADYVTKILLAADDPDSPTPYRDQPDLAGTMAQLVATIAGHSFLIAQIASRTLARTAHTLDPAEVSADRGRWRDVGAAFDRDLDRYEVRAQQVRDLLTPLAWAEGAGLPRELWASLATALAADGNYEQADITWLLEQAGFYLVETLDQDRSVYRLYHEQFAEHLRAACKPSVAHELITTELLRHVPVNAEGRREWLAVVPYIRTHLATHAVKGHALDQLISDPGFLLAADPARLLPALAAVSEPEARRSASAYESVQHLLAGQPPGQAAAQLEMAARIYGAAKLADGIRNLPQKRPWALTWGLWARPDRHILLSRQAGWIEVVGVTAIDDASAAVIVGRDGLQVWDLRTGTPRGEPFGGHGLWGRDVAVAEVDGVPLAVIVDRDGLQVWDLRTGTPHNKSWSAHDLGGRDVRVVKDKGIPLVIVNQDSVLRVWDLRTGTPRGRPLGSDGTLIIGLAVVEVDDVPIAVTSSHSVSRVITSSRWVIGDRGALQMWDLRTSTPRGEPFGSHDRSFSVLAVAKVDGVPIAVIGGRGALQMWDLRTRSPRGEPFGSHDLWVSAIATGDVDGTPVAVTGDHDGMVRVWDLRAGEPRGEPLRGHVGNVNGVAIGNVDGTPVAITSGQDRTVRKWDLRLGAVRGGPRPNNPYGNVAYGVATAKIGNTPIAVTADQDGVARVRELRTGALLGALLNDKTSLVASVAIGNVDGTPVVVTGSLDGTVQVWDLRTGAKRSTSLRLRRGLRRRRPRSHDFEWPITAVAASEINGIPVAVTSNHVGIAQVWDLRTGAPRGEPLGGRTANVETVAIGNVDGTPVAVTSNHVGIARVWDLRTGVPRGEPLVGRTAIVETVAIGNVDGTPVAVTGDRDGMVRVWDLRTGVPYGGPLHGPAGRVTALAVGEVDSAPAIVSGNDNGTISLWVLDQRERASVHLEAPAGITAIGFADDHGWLTSSSDGSLFVWHPAPIPRNKP